MTGSTDDDRGDGGSRGAGAKPPRGPGSNGGRQSRTDWYLLAGTALLYVALFAVDPNNATAALASSWSLALTIAPILLLVTLFVALSNYAVTPAAIATYLGADSGATGYVIAAVGGVLSHGPVYAWYSLLADLRDRGMRDGLIAVFLYNRAIKLPLLPLFVYYFRIEYAAVLLCTMVVASIVQGIAIERLLSSSVSR
jgi:uncharacterized membrane protein YraQ (UPF0718 family)